MPAEPEGTQRQGACHRPLPRSGRLRPAGALPLAGGLLWFTEAVRHEAGQAPVLVPAAEIPAAELARITAPRAPVCGLSLERPRIMAILNVTPDSFSDGGATSIRAGRSRRPRRWRPRGRTSSTSVAS